MKKHELTKKIYKYLFCNMYEITTQEIKNDIKEYETKQRNNGVFIDVKYLTDWIIKCIDIIDNNQENDINITNSINTCMVLLNIIENSIEQ